MQKAVSPLMRGSACQELEKERPRVCKISQKDFLGLTLHLVNSPTSHPVLTLFIVSELIVPSHVTPNETPPVIHVPFHLLPGEVILRCIPL